MKRMLTVLFYFRSGKYFREILLVRDKNLFSLPKTEMRPDDRMESAFLRLTEEYSFARSFDGFSDRVGIIVGPSLQQFSDEQGTSSIIVYPTDKKFFSVYGHGHREVVWTSRPKEHWLDPFSAAAFETDSMAPFLPLGSGG